MKYTDMIQTQCRICRREMLKKDMIRVGIQTYRYMAFKVAFHVCPDCYREFCEMYHVDPKRFD